jgi:DNA-binding LytR/AlgR family response regulator
MDKLLISGNGKGNSAIYLWCLYYILFAIAGGVLMYYASTQMQIEIAFFTFRNDRAYIAFYVGLIFIILAFIGAISISYRIQKTRIDIYETHIDGIGIRNIWMNSSPRHFRLEYDQITSFDATGNSVTIHASGTEYSCYVSNASEIQGVIFNQKQLNEKAK